MLTVGPMFCTENLKELRFPKYPFWPLLSRTKRRTCFPAGSLIPDLLTEPQVSHPPVAGTLRGPVTSIPSHSI